MDHRIQLLLTISRYDTNNFDEEALASIARIDLVKGLEALGWLLKKQFVYHHRKAYHITSVGVEFLERAGMLSKRTRNPTTWKAEALTGMTEKTSRASGHTVSEQSKIDRAVLSTRTVEGDEGLRPDKQLQELQSLDRARSSVCTTLSITPEQYQQFLREGRLRICSNGPAHIGIFDRHSENRWQHICRRCRRDKRRAKRDGRHEKDSRNTQANH